MDNKPPHKTLAIRSARDLLYKLRWESQQLDRTVNDGGNEFVYTFINAALTAWHMIDWAYEDLGKEGRDRFRTLADFRSYVRDVCGYMVICREIADGSKHAVITRHPDPEIGTIQLPVDVDLSTGIETYRPWYVETKGGMHDPGQIVRGCLSFWTEMVTVDLPIWGASYTEPPA